jgi:predicted 2-oxoglutarate/Fe(II)-dependent dioxygenase YbiX
MQEKGNYKIEVNDYGRVDRVDYVVQDAETTRFLDTRMARRVIPEIRKAFQYPVTKRERFHIARYEGARGGFQHGHRDNPTPELAHRRFALSLNLNADEYEGGALRFPEYGEQRYRAETGSALIFSSSLLHEVLEVISGHRFVLLSHFYGADSGAQPAQPRQSAP